MNLTGVWSVKVTSGPRWFRALNWAKNRKIIYGDKGHNIAAWGKWGKFTVAAHKKLLALKYINHPIVDLLDVVNDNKITGKFYYKSKYVGDFEMVKK